MAKKTTSHKSDTNLTVAMMGTQPAVSNGDADLGALLAELGAPASPDEIVEHAEETVLPEFELEAAVNAAETQEIVEQHYSDEANTETVTDAVPPTPASADAVDAAKPKKSRSKLTDEEKAERERLKAEKAAARAEAKAKREAEKAAKPKRKFYTSKVERVTDKLGAELGSYTVLTLSDASLTGDELAAKQKETLDVLNGAGIKVQNRMTMLLEFVSGKSGKLNEVIQRAFTLLKKDGFIKTGEKGNLHLDLLAKPYSPAAARAMGNNTVAALRDFKVIQKNEEGAYVANPESLILMKVNGMLGL